MIKPYTLSAALCVILTLSACESGESGVAGSNTQDGAQVEEKKPEILSVEPIGGGKWNLATLGLRSEEGGYLSKGPKVTVTDLWLIERASGETYSLLPDTSGEVSQSHFISDEVGPLRDVTLYGSYDRARAKSDDGELTYYLITISDEDDKVTLLGGTIADKETAKLTNQYDSIMHLEMLANSELAVYGRLANESLRTVIDLKTLTRVDEKIIKAQN